MSQAPGYSKKAGAGKPAVKPTSGLKGGNVGQKKVTPTKANVHNSGGIAGTVQTATNHGKRVGGIQAKVVRK